MASGGASVDRLHGSTDVRLERLKGRLFEIALVAATLVGIVSLVVLFGYIAFDTFQPLTASIQWYLIYIGTLVTPTAAFTLYARRHPPIREANAKAFAVIGGALLVSLVTYIVADALDPYDVLLYVLFGAIPPAVIGAYARRSPDRTYTGPAVVVSTLVGIALAAGLYGVLRPIVGIIAQWVAYVGIVTLPVGAIVAQSVSRRWSLRRAALAVALVLVGTLAVAVGALVAGIEPSLPVVLFSGAVVPIGYVVGDTVANEPEGRIGVLGPFVLIGSVALGAFIERSVGVQGPESYLTPSLLLNSWHGRNAFEAGIYPQLVGSIVIVGFMSLLAFPVAIGAAVYLEEYVSDSGWRGRLATLLEVNISNLAGVPSVVYGLLGLALFRNTLGFGTGVVIAAAGTLGFLILPIVIVSAQEALRSVPDSLRQAAYGMGASRWQTLRTVVIPEAFPGILTGTILALARAIGETAPLVIIAVATTTYTSPDGLFSTAAALPLQIFAARSHPDPAFRHGIVPATAVVLLILMLMMNTTAILLRNRYDRDTHE